MIVINISVASAKGYSIMLKVVGSVAIAVGGLAILPLLSPIPALVVLSFVGLWIAAVTMVYLSYVRGVQNDNIVQDIILPVAVVVVGGTFLRFAAPGWVIPFATAGTAAMLPLAILCQVQKINPSYGPRRHWELLSQVICYLIAFVLFVTVKRLGAPSFLSILAVGTVSSALAVEIFCWAGAERKRIGLYSVLTGVFLMETAWGLNFWALRGLTMGLLLLLFYYSAAGIAHHHLMGRLTSTMAMEFVAVAVIGSMLLYSFQPLAG